MSNSADTRSVLCESPFDETPLREGRAPMLEVLRGHPGGRALATYDVVDQVMSRLQLRALEAGEFAALNVSDEDLSALGSHWDELHEGGLRLVGPAFVLDADRVRATFEREKLDGVEERLEQLKSQGRLVEDAPAGDP